MIPIKAGGKFTITTEIRDKDGNLKERTVEEGENNLLSTSGGQFAGKIKFRDTMTPLEDKETLELIVAEEVEEGVAEGAEEIK